MYRSYVITATVAVLATTLFLGALGDDWFAFHDTCDRLQFLALGTLFGVLASALPKPTAKKGNVDASASTQRGTPTEV